MSPAAVTSRDELINSLWYDKHFASLSSNRARLEYAVTKYIPLESLHELLKKDIEGAKAKNGKSLTRARQFKKEADLLAKLAEDEGKGGRGGLDQALLYYHKAILHTPKSEPHLLAKLYARKSALHSKRGDPPEAALYAISTAIEVLEKRTTSPPKAEYVVLKVAALKSCKRYGQAHQCLEELLLQEQPSPQRHGNTSSVVNTEELRSMLGSLKQLVLEQEIDQMTRVCTSAHDLDGLSQSKSKLLQPYAAYQLSGHCRIENSPVVGRHFIASADIHPNQVLLEERPYSTVLSMEHAKRRCSYCFTKLAHKFYPCAECTEVVFCDQTCADLALETSHRYECGLRSAIFAIGNLSSLHVSQMVAFVGGPIRAYDAQQWGARVAYSIEEFLAEPAQRSRPHLEKSAEERWRAYTMAAKLVAHDGAHSFNENVWQTVAGLEMAALFDHLYRFRLERPAADFFLDLAAMLVVDIRRITFNVFGWQSWVSEDAGAELEHLAQAQCLVGSLVNHSCVPNTSWEFSDEGVIQFVAKQHIKAGSEITISYGAYSTQSYEQRQKRLNNYYFACACPACFADARAGTALLCPACAGPVPYESTVNRVPQLSGKCLLCFKLYSPDMDAAIAKLKSAHLALKTLKSLSKAVVVVAGGGRGGGGGYRGGHLMLLKAVQAMRTLETLSFMGSGPVQQSLLNCSAVFEQLGAGKFSATFSLEERIELALFIARHLKPQEGSLQKSFPALQFWFERLLELVAAFNDSSTQYNAYETDLWAAVFSLYEALKKAIEDVAKGGSGAGGSRRANLCRSAAAAATLAELKQGRLAAMSQSLQQSITDYGPDRVLSLRQTLVATASA